jgi:hypothetical protein
MKKLTLFIFILLSISTQAQDLFPSYCHIRKIEIRSLKPRHYDLDFPIGIDVYFKIQENDTKRVVYQSEIKWDLHPTSFPVVFEIPSYILIEHDCSYNISFYDKDDPDEDDFMVGINFNGNLGSSNIKRFPLSMEMSRDPQIVFFFNWIYK